MSETGTAAAQMPCQPGGRPAAGEDPVKREQILDGAQCVFMREGFDAASMNDIAREAGVSKGTLYVYFRNKEDLFAAIIERHKLKIFGEMREILERDLPVAEVLRSCGILFATHLLSDTSVHTMRSIIGVIDRMPSLAVTFMPVGPGSGPFLLADYLASQLGKGTLRDIDDPMFAGRQFTDLCLAGLFRPRLFGELKEAPSRERIEKNVEAAVRMFLNTYGA